MINFFSFKGSITSLSNFTINNHDKIGCNIMMSVSDQSGSIVNFVVSPETYFPNQEVVQVGDMITGFYDGNAPAILIYPPQFPALLVVKDEPNRNVKADYFDTQLISSDGQLKLNIGSDTRVVLRNGQPFTGKLGNQNLVVFYGISTRSIPAQTTPTEVIVWC